MVYALSYPRSGKSWFLYCFELVTGTKTNPPELLYYAHYAVPHNGHEELNLINDFNIKNILLLRNYKEAIFSQLMNIYGRNVDEVCFNLAVALSENGCDQASSIHPMTAAFIQQLLAAPLTKSTVENAFCKFEANHQVDDFLLEGFPIFETRPSPLFPQQPWYFIDDARANFRNTFELAFGASPVFHFHFALQLQRYYDLLDYHDKVLKTNPNNALLIKYEDFMQNPFLELSNVIDFLERTALISSKHVHSCRHNLQELMSNIDYHKDISIGAYKRSGHRAASYGNDFRRPFYTTGCSKQFLMKIDNVLKKKNPELFDRYLSGYKEEKIR